MNEANTDDRFLTGVIHVLTETFEGAQQEWSWYLDGDRNAGLLATLAALSARQASAHTPLGPTVVAHAEHIRFYLAAVTAALSDSPRDSETQTLDLTRSWDVQELDDEGWLELRARLHDEYRTLRTVLQDRVVWDDDEAGGVVAALTHVAYHLGAVRQIVKFVAYG